MIGAPPSLAAAQETVTLISYPFEWSFEQLRDAALLILDTQQHALALGMTLASASAYQVQFRGCRPVFTGEQSPEDHHGGPWAAGPEFIRQFLEPLIERSTFASIARRLPLAALFKGLSLDAWLKLQRRIITALRPRTATLGEAIVREDPCLGDGFKRIVVSELLHHRRPLLVYDLGIHTGEFARLAVASGAACVSFDPDPAFVDAAYKQERAVRGSRLLPLVLDTASGPAARPEADLVIALALCHHLHLMSGTLLPRQASFLRRLGRAVLVEFCPSSGYSLDEFLSAFRPYFNLRRLIEVPATNRRLCLFEAP